jgi:hypothetical protein
MSRLLLCTDLDRTLLPNGTAPESPCARKLFARLASHPQVILVYVTGRDPDLVEAALAAWAVPPPDLLIANVGTTIAGREPVGWRRWEEWDQVLAPDWNGRTGAELRGVLQGVADLKMQDDSRQGLWKVSLQTPPDADPLLLTAAVRERLDPLGVRASVIWSRDEDLGAGLLDVLPAGADKSRAIAFVMERLGYGLDEVVFAGDSGNDLDVLTGPIPSVVVANAAEELRATATVRRSTWQPAVRWA